MGISELVKTIEETDLIGKLDVLCFDAPRGFATVDGKKFLGVFSYEDNFVKAISYSVNLSNGLQIEDKTTGKIVFHVKEINRYIKGKALSHIEGSDKRGPKILRCLDKDYKIEYEVLVFDPGAWQDHISLLGNISRSDPEEGEPYDYRARLNMKFGANYPI